MKLNLKVVPCSGRREIVEDKSGIKVFLKSSPKKNKANFELIKFLKKYFKKNIRIISGLSSRRKVVKVDAD